MELLKELGGVLSTLMRKPVDNERIVEYAKELGEVRREIEDMQGGVIQYAPLLSNFKPCP